MSRPDSYYKRYLVEVSLEHYNIVRREQFWPERVRVRNFKGNGSQWECTDNEVVSEEGTGTPPSEEGTATTHTAVANEGGSEPIQNARVNEEVQPTNDDV